MTMTTMTNVMLRTAGDEAVIEMTGVDAGVVRVRLTRDADGAGWVTCDSWPLDVCRGWVRDIRAAGLSADEAVDDDDRTRAWLYVGGVA